MLPLRGLVLLLSERYLNAISDRLLGKGLGSGTRHCFEGVLSGMVTQKGAGVHQESSMETRTSFHSGLAAYRGDPLWGEWKRAAAGRLAQGVPSRVVSLLEVSRSSLWILNFFVALNTALTFEGLFSCMWLKGFDCPSFCGRWSEHLGL